MRESSESRFRRNAEVWLAENNFPPARLFDIRSDRCLIEGDGTFPAHCDGCMDPWEFCIAKHRPFGIDTAMRGWRERRALYAAQMIEHSVCGRTCYELDFDDSNPDWGLAPLIGHGIQCLVHWICGTKTNPFTVAKKRGW